MRTHDATQRDLFCYVPMEEFIPRNHPARRLREMADRALRAMSPDFERLYSHRGRPGVPPEQILRALLVQVLFSVRSERRLMQDLHYNLLYRWFVGLEMGDAVWDVTVFTKNRERFVEGEIAERFFAEVLEQARGQNLLSEEHFSVDGTLIEAWAGQKSYRAKDELPPQGSGRRGEMLKRDRYESTTDPQARLYRKSASGAMKLCYMGHLVTENRHGLIVASQASEATTKAERQTGLELARRLKQQRFRPKTMGADKAYNEQDFVAGLAELGIQAHAPAYEKAARRDWAGERQPAREDVQISQKKRKLIERCFGWMKTVGLQRKTRFRGLQVVNWMFVLCSAAHNLVRMGRLIEIETAMS
jgi:transposase